MPMNKKKYHRLIPLLLLVVVSMAVYAAGTDEQATEPKAIKEFKPTEKIQADSAVSFPIDI